MEVVGETMESGLGVIVFSLAVTLVVSGIGAMLFFASDALERWLDASLPANKRAKPSRRARARK
jgi:hypothetical protein